MSDHDHTSDHGSHGVPPPPADDVLAGYAMGEMRGAEPVPLHFFAGPGPLDMTPVKPRAVRLRDGRTRRCTWEFRWFLDRVEGTSRTNAAKRIHDVLLDPNGWTRAGVHWKRVYDRAAAHIVVRAIPMDTTVCGPGAAGCYSWGYEADRKPVAEMGVEYIDRPGPWAALVGMELQGHGTFRADDQYLAVHLPYVCGVMGTWQAMACAGYLPTDQEVTDTVTWLQGRTPSERIHGH